MLVAQIIQNVSNCPEIKGDLGREQQETEDRIHRSIRGFCESWYQHLDQRVIFDKGRGWPLHALALRKLYPESKMIILVRDLREVFASIEKQHRKNPLLDSTPTNLQKSIYSRADRMFSPEGMIGICLEGIHNLLDSRLDVHWLKYEDFAANPQEEMNRLYCYLLEETEFQHDFENVVNTSTDPDFLYLNKFPHKGEGRIRPANLSWPGFMSRDLANLIMSKFTWYNQRFGYVATI